MLDRTIAPAFQEIGDIHLRTPEKRVLKNGLNVYLFNSPNHELVRFEWIFQNRFDASETPLINTVLANMLKEGTKTLSSAEIAGKVDFYGGFLLSDYNFDTTSLTLYTLHKHIAKLLPVVKDILTDATFPEKELSVFLTNNKHKLRVSLETADFLARRYFYNDLFGTQNRYGKTAEAVDYDHISREQLLALYAEQIRPDNAVLMVSGNISADLLEQLEDLFGEKWTSESPLTVSSEPVIEKGKTALRVENKKDALQSAIRLGNQTISRQHPDFPALQIVNTILGGYFGSRLMRNIREDKGYTYGIGSAVVSLEHTAFLTIATEVGVEVTEATLKEIEKEIQLLRTEAISEDELSLVKNYVEGNMLAALESIFSHADRFKNVFFSGLDLTYYDYYLSELKKMTPERVQEIANTYINFDQMTKVVVGNM